VRRSAIAFLKHGLGCMIIQHRKLRSFAIWGFAWDGSVTGFSGGRTFEAAKTKGAKITEQRLVWRPVPISVADLVTYGRHRALRQGVSCPVPFDNRR
jgi:hypothetical protein